MCFEIGRGRLHYGGGRPFHGCHYQFSPIKKNIGSDDSFDISKADVDVHFVDTDVYFKMMNGSQNVEELHSNCQKNPGPYSLTAYPAFMKWMFASVFENTDAVPSQSPASTAEDASVPTTMMLFVAVD